MIQIHPRPPMRVGVIFVFINPLTLQLELVELLGSDLAPSELTCTIPLHGCRYLKVWFK